MNEWVRCILCWSVATADLHGASLNCFKMRIIKCNTWNCIDFLIYSAIITNLNLLLPREAAMLALYWGWQFCLCVCLSVTRVLSDDTKEHTTDILIPYERAIVLIFWHQHWSGRHPLPPKICSQTSKWLPFWKTPISTTICLWRLYRIRTREKCSVIANRKSTTRFLTSYRWSAYVTPDSQRVAQKANILSYLWIKLIYVE